MDLELDRWFRSIEDCRKSLLSPLSRVLGLLGVSDSWRRYGRPTPPRLLLLFEKCAISQEDLRDFADGDYARTKRKRAPQKRLIDSLQNQVYNIFRHSRIITDKGKLFFINFSGVALEQLLTASGHGVLELIICKK